MKKVIRCLCLGLIPFIIISLILMPIMGIAALLRCVCSFSYDLSIGLSSVFVFWVSIAVILYLFDRK